MAQILQPRRPLPAPRPVEGPDPLQIIAQSLGIVGSIYGIRTQDKQLRLFAQQQEQQKELDKAGFGKVAQARQQAEQQEVTAAREQTRFDRESKTFQAKEDKQARLARGELTPVEALELSQKSKGEFVPDPAGRFEINKQRVSFSKAPAKINLTPGQRKQDETFGKAWAEFKSQGKSADVDKSLTQLDEAVAKLKEKGELTGTASEIVLPNKLRKIFAEESIAVQQSVEEVVQRNLRLVLGAQFTEKEGERLIARAFDEDLSEAENIKRVERLAKQIRGSRDAMIAAGRHFDEFGTVENFKGTLNEGVKANQLFAGKEPAKGGGLTDALIPKAAAATQGPKDKELDEMLFKLLGIGK